MIYCNFSDFKVGDLEKKVKQYYDIQTNIRPEDSTFQDGFSKFYKLNNSTWKNPAIMKPLFFNLFSAFVEMKQKFINVEYTTVLILLSRVTGITEKSFSSKILHTLYTDKPILDSKVIAKLKNNLVSEFTTKTGYSGPVLTKNTCSIDEAIDFYDKVCNYYLLLVATNTNYINDFNNWLTSIGISHNSISNTKKIDFWMWLT